MLSDTINWESLGISRDRIEPQLNSICDKLVSQRASITISPELMYTQYAYSEHKRLYRSAMLELFFYLRKIIPERNDSSLFRIASLFIIQYLLPNITDVSLAEIDSYIQAVEMSDPRITINQDYRQQIGNEIRTLTQAKAEA